MSKKVFWTRLISYIIFGGVVPVAFLIWRFGLFHKVSKISIGGWGMVAIILGAGFIIHLAKQLKKGVPYSYTVQIITGLLKVTIPLTAAAMIVHLLKDLNKELFQFLVVTAISETLAFMFNPLPRWEYENGIKEDDKKFGRFIDAWVKKDKSV